MRRALVPQIPKKVGEKIVLSDGEARHLTQVLRLRNGEEITLLDGQGYFAQAKLVFQDRGATAEITQPPQTDPRLISQPIHLYMAIIKGDAMEWVIEKAVELGVRQLTPVESEFTVVKVERKGAETFQERWQKIADQALKQCGRLDRMIVEPIQNFEGALAKSAAETLYWTDETLARSGQSHDHLANQSFPAKSALIVGPEGGFSPIERQRLLELTGSEKRAIKRVHLGAPILRAETAALFGVSLLVGHGKRENQV